MSFWKTVLRWVLIAFCALIVGVAVGGFFLPSTMEVEEQTVINAPAGAVYDRVANLKTWNEWAPWWDRDPFLETELNGPASGLGAHLKWRSKHNGEGQVKIIAVAPGREVGMAIDFGEFGDAESLVRLEEKDGRTTARWLFRTSFGGNTGRRYFGLFFRRSVARDFAEALAKLKAVCENPVPAKAE